jgi:hypothetical protein
MDCQQPQPISQGRSDDRRLSKHRWNKLPFRIPTVAALPASGSQWAPLRLLIVAYTSTSGPEIAPETDCKGKQRQRDTEISGKASGNVPVSRSKDRPCPIPARRAAVWKAGRGHQESSGWIAQRILMRPPQDSVRACQRDQLSPARPANGGACHRASLPSRDHHPMHA